MKEKSISVVITSYNTRNLLRECIISALNQMDLNKDEIIVVDNKSHDGSPEMVQKEFPQIRLFVSEKNAGFAYGCNKGFRESSSDLIIFANGDITFPPGSISNMLKKISEDSKIGILSPVLVSPNGQISQMTWGWDISLFGELRQKFFSPSHVAKWGFMRSIVSRIQQDEKNVPIVAGACMLIRRELLEKINGFDENFELYFEDADICLRCREAGYFVRFTSFIQVIHGLGESGKSIPQKIALIYRQSQIYFYRKHHTSIELFILKIYLSFKFLFSRNVWTDSVFRTWIINILRERKRILLSESF